VPEGMKTNALALMRDAEFVQKRMEDRRNHLVSGIRAASTVHEEKFMVMAHKMRSELLAQQGSHWDTVLGLFGLQRLNLSVPSRLSNMDLVVVKIHIFNAQAENLRSA
jgi:hypothetical protein